MATTQRTAEQSLRLRFPNRVRWVWAAQAHTCTSTTCPDSRIRKGDRYLSVPGTLTAEPIKLCTVCANTPFTPAADVATPADPFEGLTA